MSGSIKLGLILIVAVLVLGTVVRLVSSVLGFLVPLAIIAGVGLIVYGLVSRKPLGSGRRRYLP
jgi:hypothetical protein